MVWNKRITWWGRQLNCSPAGELSTPRSHFISKHFPFMLFLLKLLTARCAAANFCVLQLLLSSVRALLRPGDICGFKYFPKARKDPFACVSSLLPSPRQWTSVITSLWVGNSFLFYLSHPTRLSSLWLTWDVIFKNKYFNLGTNMTCDFARMGNVVSPNFLLRQGMLLKRM